MDYERQSYFKGRLSQAVVEFFDHYGVDCASVEPGTPRDADPAQGEVGSIVGFKGANVRGGLAFVAPAGLIQRMLPVPSVAGRADLQLRDWSAEIANQLIGRFKNKLSAPGWDFDVGTAVCFRCTSLELEFLPNSDGISLSFATASAAVRVYLDCSFLAGAIWPEELGVENVAEGDVVLF
jgi:CheY-specific phosphatase CheX